MTDYFNSAELQALVTRSDREKPLFLAQRPPLHDYGFVAFESSSDKAHWVPCTVSEERYALADNYKITLVPMVQGFGRHHYYQMDLTQLVREGQVLVLDQAIPWQDQVPKAPEVTLAEQFAHAQIAVKATLKSWLTLPRMSR